jgi:hypothetical protein
LKKVNGTVNLSATTGSTFLSEQISHQQPVSRTFLKTNQHQPSATSQTNRLMQHIEQSVVIISTRVVYLGSEAETLSVHIFFLKKMAARETFSPYMISNSVHEQTSRISSFTNTVVSTR